MFESSIQTADYFRRGFKQGLRFRIIHLFHIFSKMFDQFPELAPNVGNAGSSRLMQNPS